MYYLHYWTDWVPGTFSLPPGRRCAVLGNVKTGAMSLDPLDWRIASSGVVAPDLNLFTCVPIIFRPAEAKEREKEKGRKGNTARGIATMVLAMVWYTSFTCVGLNR